MSVMCQGSCGTAAATHRILHKRVPCALPGGKTSPDVRQCERQMPVKCGARAAGSQTLHARDGCEASCLVWLSWNMQAGLIPVGDASRGTK